MAFPMKLIGVFACAGFVAGCGAAAGPATSVTHSSAAFVETAVPSGSAKAEAGPAADASKKGEPPTAVADEPLPNIVFTPPAEVRATTLAKLKAAVASIKTLTTASAVEASLTRSLGKPTWIEDEKVRVWVAHEATQCARVVLQQDGSVDLESMRFNESKSVSRSARQNLCTGQIERDQVE